MAPTHTHGAASGGRVVLASPIKKDRQYHVAFTVSGWPRGEGESEFRLFVDGELVDESVNGKSIEAVNPKDEAGQPMIFIGNSEALDMPFHGQIRPPRMSVLDLSPAEVRLDYAGLAR